MRTTLFAVALAGSAYATDAVADKLADAMDKVADAAENLVREGEKSSADVIKDHWSVETHTSCINATNACTWNMTTTWTALHTGKWNEVTAWNGASMIAAWHSVQKNDEAAAMMEARVLSKWNAKTPALEPAAFSGWKATETKLGDWMDDGKATNWDKADWVATADLMKPMTVTCAEDSNQCVMKMVQPLIAADAAEGTAGLKVGDKMKCQGAMTGYWTESAKSKTPVWDTAMKGEEVTMEILKGASTLVAGAVAIATATLF